MKRSEINRYLVHAARFIDSMQFALPPWAHWSPAKWEKNASKCTEIFENHLGWDVTDFGLGEFNRRGLLLFTVRNGAQNGSGKPYAEKIMVVRDGQETPFHYHWNKTEDIINRGGGNLVLELALASEQDTLSDQQVTVQVDGITTTRAAGKKLILRPGESVTLPPRLYHRFWGERGRGWVLTGEVSKVNDDLSDNRFLDPIGRFPEILEDEPALRLLVTDYRSVGLSQR